MLRGLSIILNPSYFWHSLSFRYFFTIPFKKTYAYFFIVTLPLSYLIWFVRNFLSDSGDYTLGNSCEDLICYDLPCWRYVIIVCEKVLIKFFFSRIAVVEFDRSLAKSILNITLLWRAVFLMTELYFFVVFCP